jgi:hypothetical protein
MPLNPAQLEALTASITDAFQEDGLRQLVRFKLGADMYKEWVAPDKPLRDTVFALIAKLEELGTTISLIDAVLGARPDRADLQKQLTAIKTALASPIVPTAGQVDDVRKGISEVGNRLTDAAMRQTVVDLEDILHKLADEIALLRTYKSLHDCLHNLQMQLRSLATAARNLASDPIAAADLVQSITQLRTLRDSVVAAIEDLPAAPPYRGFENAWLTQLDQAVELAQRSSDGNDPLLGREGIHEIRSILRREPSRIDRSLSMTADSLQLADLKNLFAKAGATPGLTDGERQRFLTREVSAEQLFRLLKALVNQHTQWQSVEGSLWEADDRLPKSEADDPSDFDALWSGIKRRVSALIDTEPQTDWARKIAERRDKVDALRKDDDWTKLALEFARFRQESIVRFFAVDTSLRQMAEEVDTIGETLLKLLTDLKT